MNMYVIMFTGTPNIRAVIGFAESYEQLMEENNKRTHPYKYDKDYITEVKLTPDIFGPCYLEGQSNFRDYLKMGDKIS